MKKTVKKAGILLACTLCAATAAAGLAACGEEDTYSTLESGVSTTLVTTKSPEELSPENVLYAFLQKQTELTSYKIVTEGKAVADIAGYEQDIHNTTYKNGEDFLNEASSDSVLVKMKHQAFSKNGTVVYRDGFDGELKVATKEDYKKVYGFTADDVALGGYILNNKTVRYAKLEKAEGETLTYYFRLAGDLSKESGAATESATTGVRLQAKAYGSLDDIPAFSDVDVTLTLKKDWTPVSYTSECSYDCKKVLNMSIKQTLRCTYTDVNGTVSIPSVEDFNNKLGTTPSAVAPAAQEQSPVMQLVSAFGAAFDEEKVSLPFKVGIDLFGAPIALEGNALLKLSRVALESGDLSNAFTLRCDVDISGFPLLSRIANTLTVRYLGEEGLFLMLNNRVEGKDQYVFTYAADLSALTDLTDGLDLSLDQLPAIAEQAFDIQKTDTGYRVALKPSFIALLNAGYQQLVAQAGSLLGDTHGYVSSLLGSTITALYADVQGVEKVTGISLAVEGTPAENATMGEKIDISIDIGLLNSSGLFSGAFEGELQIRLNPAAIWAQDFFAIAQGKLHLDLTPAQLILQMLGMFGGMIPDLPSWLSADLNSLDIYYLGDGILMLTLNNAEKNPVFTTDLDLTQYLPAAAALGDEADGTQGVQGLKLPQLIFEIKENGFAVSLGENLVQALNTAYGALVQTAVDYVTEAAGGMGEFAGAMIKSWLGAEITGAGIFVGKTDEGQLTFDLNVDGIPAISPEEETSLLSITLTHLGELNADEKTTLLALGETVKELRAMNDKAAEYDAQVQKLIEEMDVTDTGYTQYVAKVTALQEKIASEKDGVKSLMTTKSYLAETTYEQKQYSVLLLTAALYHERATEFKTKEQAIQANSSEGEWDELNALYEKSATISDITVPAVKENEVLKAAVGKDTLESYLAKRKEHETELADDLSIEIAAATAEFNAEENQNRNGWTKGLTKIVTDFKPVYDKLPDDLKEKTGYQAFVKLVYNKNIEELLKEYNRVKTRIEELYEEDSVSFEQDLLPILKDLAQAYAWGFGYDYWETNTIEKVQPWGTTWITSLKPADLSEEEQTKVSDLNMLNRSLMKGTIATEVLGKYTDLIINEVRDLYTKIGKCRIVGDDGKDTWNFGTLENQEAVLEEVHGVRFLICKVLPTAINDEIGKDDPDLKKFMQIDITKYEEALVEHLKTTSGD